MKQENAYKIKLLKLLEILRQDSDEDHYIGTTELIDKLADMGIVCDRRTLAALHKFYPKHDETGFWVTAAYIRNEF